MKSNTYSRLFMAPLLALLAVACSPNQFNQSTEYDDVYYTSSDRSAQTTAKKQATQTLLVTQEKQATVDNYSADVVDANIVNKYNNGQPTQVTYFEEGPLVQSAQDLNFDDFIVDYENENLAYYQLPLDWSSDWTRNSFNNLMDQDFHFRLAWYDQYYLGKSFRMTQYMSGRSGRLSSRGFNNFGPRVGIGIGVGFNNFAFGFSNMAFVDLNPWGFYDPFWSPRRRFFGSFNRFNDPFFNSFYCPPFYNSYNSWGWRGGWNNNVFVNNNIYTDRRADRILANNNNRSQDVRRGPRVGTSRIATVRNEAINGSSPSTRSSRYADNLNSGTRTSRNGRAAVSTGTGRANSTASRATNTSRNGLSTTRSSNRVRTDAYRFNNGNSRTSRSSSVRNNSSSSVSRGTSSGTRASSRSTASSSRSRSSSNPSFNRSSSSSRSSYGSSSRTSRSSNRSSSSSSRSGYSRGSSSRSSGSSSRSSGSASRSSSSRSSGSARSGSSSSRSSGSASRGSSSSSRSSSSSSSRSSSSSSRSGRGN